MEWVIGLFKDDMLLKFDFVRTIKLAKAIATTSPEDMSKLMTDTAASMRATGKYPGQSIISSVLNKAGKSTASNTVAAAGAGFAQAIRN